MIKPSEFDTPLIDTGFCGTPLMTETAEAMDELGIKGIFAEDETLEVLFRRYVIARLNFKDVKRSLIGLAEAKELADDVLSTARKLIHQHDKDEVVCKTGRCEIRPLRAAVNAYENKVYGGRHESNPGTDYESQEGRDGTDPEGQG